MAKTNPKRKKPASETGETIDFTQRFLKETFLRLQKFKKKKGFSTEQEAIRVIVTNELERNGF